MLFENHLFSTLLFSQSCVSNIPLHCNSWFPGCLLHLQPVLSYLLQILQEAASFGTALQSIPLKAVRALLRSRAAQGKHLYCVFGAPTEIKLSLWFKYGKMSPASFMWIRRVLRQKVSVWPHECIWRMSELLAEDKEEGSAPDREDVEGRVGCTVYTCWGLGKINLLCTY